jgi:hypothetical protein
MALPLMPIQLLFPFPWAKMSNKHLVLAWDKGPCCNFAHFLSATIVLSSEGKESLSYWVSLISLSFQLRLFLSLEGKGKPILLGFFTLSSSSLSKFLEIRNVGPCLSVMTCGPTLFFPFFLSGGCELLGVLGYLWILFTR